MAQRSPAMLAFAVCLGIATASVTARAQLTQSSDSAWTLGSWRQAWDVLRRHQPQLDAQKAAVASAQAAVNVALASLLPQIQASAGADYSLVRPAYGEDLTLAQHQFFASSSLIPRAAASVELRLSLSALSAVESAELGLAASRAERVTLTNRLRRQLAAAVWTVVAAQRMEERAGAGVQAAAERLQLVRRLRVLGRATLLDELRFANDQHDADAAHTEARRALQTAQSGLGAALGLGQPAQLSSDFDAHGLRDGDDCSELTQLSQRSELKAARLRVQEANSAATAAANRVLPELRVRSDYAAMYRPSSAVTFDGERQVLHGWTATVELAWRAWDGGLRAAELRQRRADTAAKRAFVTLESRRVTRQAALAAELVTLATESLRIAQERYDTTRTSDELARRAYELGNASALETVDTASRLRRVSIELALRDVELLDASAAQRMWWTQCQ